MDRLPLRNPGLLFAGRVVAFAAVVPLLLRLVKISELGRWLEPRNPIPDLPAPRRIDRALAAAAAGRVDALVRRAWPVVRRGCLVRGLTLYRFLREMGLDVNLCFGIGQPDGEEEFSGHCWIELDGLPLGEKREPRAVYTETYRIAPRRLPAAHRVPAAARPETA